MNKNIIENLVKISDLNAKNMYEIKRISYDNKYLVPCESIIEDEEVTFVYNIEALRPLSELKKERDIEKLRFLVNIYDLLSLSEVYSFSLAEDNLYYDYNFNPKILRRDIKPEETIIDKDDIVSQYKSILGMLFIKKRSYNDFYNGGINLLKSNKTTKKYISLSSAQDIKEKLISDLEEAEKYNKENFMEVKKHDYKLKKHSIRVMGLAIAGLEAYSIYSGAFVNPFNKNVIKGNYAYMEQDYEGVINALEKADKVKFMKLDKNSKYELAYSYIMSESLSENQRKNVLLNLTSKTDENILDYWIALGEVKYDDAIDLAKKLQDNELLLYALLNKDKYIQDDTTLSGEEKDAKQQAVKSEIDKITQQLTKEEGAESGSSGLNEKSDAALNNGGDAKHQAAAQNTQTGAKGGSESSGVDLAPAAN